MSVEQNSRRKGRHSYGQHKGAHCAQCGKKAAGTRSSYHSSWRLSPSLGWCARRGLIELTIGQRSIPIASAGYLGEAVDMYEYLSVRGTVPVIVVLDLDGDGTLVTPFFLHAGRFRLRRAQCPWLQPLCSFVRMRRAAAYTMMRMPQGSR